MTRRTHYTTEIRVLLCDACGAPIEATPEGGQVACAYCRAQNQIRLKPKESALAPPQQMISDDERWRLLRMQDGKPMVAPQALAYLFAGGGLHPAKIQEAFFSFDWAGSALEAEFSKSGEAQFIPITFKDDWAVIRQIDEANGVSYACQ